jgi:hypothetical protein
MQGRLTKIWFLNIHYADNTIMHKDTRLNFCIKNEATEQRTEAGNCIISLENGDGKGLILQLVTNLFDPMVDWKDGKNKMEHLFFNSKGKPIRYTGYIVGELDVGDDRRLMLGLGITPRIITREQQREERSDITVDFIQFVREYSVEDNFDIYDLPLYDEEKEDGVSFSTLKKIVDDDYQDLIEIINVNNRSSYTQLLHSYGYTASAISNMKQINQKEGSVEAFFSNALTNEGIFFNKIIPSINDELQNTDSTKETSDLVTSFMDTVKIAKDLPEMMIISDSAEVIKELLGPVKESLKQGLELDEKRITIRKKGYTIKDKLNDVHQENTREINSIINQITNQNETLDRLNYEIDNADYSKTYSEKLESQREFYRVEQGIESQIKFLGALNQELMREQINRHLKEFDQYQNEIDLKSQLKSELEESLDHQELVSKIRDIRKKIQNRWEVQIHPKWKDILTTSEIYQSKCEREIEKLEIERSDLIEKRGEINNNKKTLNKAIETHKVKLDTVITKRHGEKVRYNLEAVIKDTESRIDQIERDRIQSKSDLGKNQNKYTEAISKKNVLEHKKELREQELSLLQTELVRATDVENMLSENVSDYLKEEDAAKQTREWFQSKIAKISTKLDKYNEMLEMNKRTLWGMESDLLLIKESEDIDVWIPNQEVLSLKRKLDDQGIPCMLGAELLSTLSSSMREKELERHPLIPYSVIVMQKDFPNIDISLLKEDINHSLVTILVRQQMKNERVEESILDGFYKVANSGYVVQGKGYEIIKNEEAWEYWKVDIEDSAEKLEEDNNALSRLIEEGKWIVERIRYHLLKKVVFELLAEEKQLNDEIQSFVVQIDSVEEELKVLENELTKLNRIIEEKGIEVERERDNLRGLLAWEEECLVNDRNLIDLSELENESKLLSEALESIRNNIEDKSGHITTFQNELTKWVFFAKEWLRKIQVAAVGATFPNVNIETNVDVGDVEKPSLSESIDPQSQLLLETYQELNAKEGSSNFKIERLNSEISTVTSLRNSIIGWLNLNGGEWEGTSIPEETVTEIEEKERQIKRKIKNAELEIQEKRYSLAEIKSNLKNFEDRLKMQRNAVLEKHRKEPVYIGGLNYDAEKASLKQQRDEIVGILDSLTNSLNAVKEIQSEIVIMMETYLANISSEMSPCVLTEGEKQLAKTNPRRLVGEWSSEKSSVEVALEKYKMGLEKEYNQIQIEIEKKKTISSRIKEPFKNVVLKIQSSHFREAIQMIEGIIFWAEKEVEKRAETKKQCEQAVRFFTKRCSKRVEDVITGLKIFVNKMKVRNMDGDFVELVRFEKSYKFPNSKEEIELKIKEYCENTIASLVKKHPITENIKIKDVEPYVNISQLMKIVLERFPKLYLYIPDGSGSLLTEKPKEHLYKEWEVINIGDNRSSSKSGGQTIMAHMILISMLQKKANDDHWTMIVTDNLFGAMSAKKLVQPLFAVLEMLKVQWVTVVPANAPVQITSNFDIVYLLSVNYSKGKGVVTYDVEQYERRYLHRLQVIEGLRKEASYKETI